MGADGKTLQIPQTLAAVQDPDHRHQLQVLGLKPNAAHYAGIVGQLIQSRSVAGIRF